MLTVSCLQAKCSCPVNKYTFLAMCRIHRQVCNWQLKYKYVDCWKHFPAFQADLLSQGLNWQEADSQWFNLYLFLLSSRMPSPRKDKLSLWRRGSNSACCRHNLSSGGTPAWSTHRPQINHWWIHSTNEFSPLATDNFGCYEIADDLSGRGTLTEYLYSGQGQYCYKGMKQPSLM